MPGTSTEFSILVCVTQGSIILDGWVPLRHNGGCGGVQHQETLLLEEECAMSRQQASGHVTMQGDNRHGAAWRLVVQVAAGWAVFSILLVPLGPIALALGAEPAARDAADISKSPSDRANPGADKREAGATAPASVEEPTPTPPASSPRIAGRCCGWNWTGCRLRLGGWRHRTGCQQ